MSKLRTSLTFRDISYVEDSIVYFGKSRAERGLKPGEKVIVLTVTPPIFDLRLHCSIPSGVHVIISNWGVIDPKPVEAGLMWLPFWRKIEWVVNRQFIPIDVPVRTCPTADNVMIHIDSLALIRIQDPFVFITSIGPEKLLTVLRAFIEEAIRGVARTIGYFEAYDIRGHELTGMVRSLNEKIKDYGCFCKDVTIQDIFLPNDLVETLTRESSFYSLLKAQQRGTDFRSLQINNEELRKTVHLQRENERSAVSVQAQKVIGMIKKEEEELKSITSLRLKEIESEQRANVLTVHMNNELECNKILGKKEKDFKSYNFKWTKEISDNLCINGCL